MAETKTKQKTEKTPVSKKVEKENGWIKFLRVVIYAIFIPGVAVGASLIKTGASSASYADGTYAAKIHNGEVIFFISLIILCANIMWGMLRWFLRASREQWRAGRIVGKLIGGGLWRTVVIAPIVIASIIFIAPLIAEKVSPSNELPVIISDDYGAEFNRKIKDMANNPDSYSTSELAKYYNELTLANVDFGVDASSNITTASDIFSQKAYAEGGVTILNKARLSRDSHFVIFYTDVGDDKISDVDAAEIADFLEGLIEQYSDQFGQNWGYQQYKSADIFNTRAKRINAVLENSGISTNILETAMPVYVVDTNREDCLAYYSIRENADFLSDIGRALHINEGDETSYTTISFPYILIRPQRISEKVDLAEVVAHELAHHYAANYCHARHGGPCAENFFISETFANYWSVSATMTQTEDDYLAGHHKDYVNFGVCYPINTIIGSPDGRCNAKWKGSLLGYASFAFLYNYAHIEGDDYVKSRNDVIMEALSSETPLEVLYGNSHYAHVTYGGTLVALSQKNLTHEYGGKKSLEITEIPKGIDLPCSDACTQKYQIDHSSANYFYFSTAEYNGRKVIVNNNINTMVSILARKAESGNWVVVDQTPYNIMGVSELSTEDRAKLTEMAYGISKDSGFDLIAVVVTDITIGGSPNSYTLQIISDKLEDIIEEPQPDENLDETSDTTSFQDVVNSGNGCAEINISDLFDQINSLQKNFTNAVAAFIEAADGIDRENDYSGAVTELKNSSIEAEKGINEAKGSLSHYRATFCIEHLKSGTSFSEAKQKVRSVMGYSINFYENLVSQDKISIFANFDILSRSGKVHALIQSGSELDLITISITEK